MAFYFDPLDKACKSLTGAIARSRELSLRIYHTAGGEDFFSADISLQLWRDGQQPSVFPMMRKGDYWVITIRLNQTGLYFYRFAIGDCFLGRGKMRRGVLTHTPESWQLTVYDESYRTPDWIKGGIMYQIFPDRFCRAEGGDAGANLAGRKLLRGDWGGVPNYRPNEFGKVLNNDFFGGNLNGIREKLDYLRRLHVSVIYLNPIFEAYSNHRYDTGDYMKIDSLLGTSEDFDCLVNEAEKRGIRIILDGVFNHTGDDSRYFNKYGNYHGELGAYESKQSPYFEWYRFRDFPDNYESWWGIDTLPAVNEASLSYQEFIFGREGVLRHWLQHGIGGYRLDVADELPDFFLKKLRAAVKESDPEAVIIGEVWEDASNKIAYSERREYLQGSELDSVMNYPLMDAIISYVMSGKTTQLRETIAMLIDNYPKQTLDCLMNILGTHDTSRILTKFGNKFCATKDEMARTYLEGSKKEDAKKKVKMAAVLQFMLPGLPCIYYGDENAMEGYQDPFCRRCFDWEHLDEDMISFYKKLGKLRTQKFAAVCKDGDYREVFADAACLVFERRSGDEVVYVYVNNSAAEYSIAVNGKFEEHLSGKHFSKRLIIGGHSYGIVSKR